MVFCTNLKIVHTEFVLLLYCARAAGVSMNKSGVVLRCHLMRIFVVVFTTVSGLNKWVRCGTAYQHYSFHINAHSNKSHTASNTAIQLYTAQVTKFAVSAECIYVALTSGYIHIRRVALWHLICRRNSFLRKCTLNIVKSDSIFHNYPLNAQFPICMCKWDRMPFANNKNL